MSHRGVNRRQLLSAAGAGLLCAGSRVCSRCHDTLVLVRMFPLRRRVGFGTHVPGVTVVLVSLQEATPRVASSYARSPFPQAFPRHSRVPSPCLAQSADTFR